MKSINFILGMHNHQPVGNFDAVFEEAYQKSYLPMLEALHEFPSIRVMYHTTGPLYDWLETRHPEYFDLLGILIQRNQLEIISSGYQEPILAIIPDRDKLGQITKMTRYISDRLGVKARGLWMAERVWEPHLAKTLAESGIDFLMLDDYHFFSAGMNPDELLGYYQTDDQGYGVAIFPISKKLRYLIPFAAPEEALSFLHEKADEDGDKLMVMADDGEKFGLWPGTYEWVHEKGWLKKFFRALEAAMAEGWLKMTTCSEFREQHPPSGRVYLPCASYFEMSEWSLPAESGAQFEKVLHRLEDEGRLDELRPFLKGGFWRNFLAKYDESNRMYRKMLWVSDLVHRLSASRNPENKSFHEKLSSAQNHLYKGQCNCAYWHGVFGGLYLPHLRQAVYQNLLQAEEICHQLNGDDEGFSEKRQADFDADGSEEIYLRNLRLGIIISLREGGAIYEFDYLPAHFNLLNTLRRQREAYHWKVSQANSEIKEGQSIHDQLSSKEKGLERLLVYDRSLRGALIDHFLSVKESPKTLHEGKYYELGNFAGQPYETKPSAAHEVQLRRLGSVVDNIVEVQKSVSFLKDMDGLRIEYRISNLSAIPLTILFAPEFNFALLAGEYPDQYYYHSEPGLKRAALNSIGISERSKRFSLVNESDRFAIHFYFEQPTEIWRYPCETVSLSEAGFEKVYQSSCVLPVYRLAVEKNGIFEAGFQIQIERLHL